MDEEGYVEYSLSILSQLLQGSGEDGSASALGALSILSQLLLEIVRGFYTCVRCLSILSQLLHA